MPLDDAHTFVLLFRWRAGFPAKHAAIITAGELMVHAFRFPGVNAQGET